MDVDMAVWKICALCNACMVGHASHSPVELSSALGAGFSIYFPFALLTFLLFFIVFIFGPQRTTTTQFEWGVGVFGSNMGGIEAEFWYDFVGKRLGFGIPGFFDLGFSFF